MRTLAGLTFFVLLLTACNSDDCDKSCENNGILTINCDCECRDGFTGDLCETPTCTLECQNFGTLQSDCTCDCLPGWGGDACDQCVPTLGLVQRQEIWASGGQGEQVNDMKVILPEDYLLTGVAFNRISTLIATGRELMNDGSLGPAAEFRDGSDPNGTVAVAYTVPDGSVITGVGYGESQNVYRLVVNYSEILFDDDCQAYLGTEQLYDNQADHPVTRWLKISDWGYNTKYNAFGSIGLAISSSFGRQVETDVREILNQ